MDIKKHLEDMGYTDLKESEDGSYAGLMNFIFTTGLMVGMTQHSYKVRYCYEHRADALEALKTYTDGSVPEGPWIKAKGEGIDALNPKWSCKP